MSHGGARPGTGPKPTGRKPHSFYITEEEHEMLMKTLLRHRFEKHPEDFVRDIDKPNETYKPRKGTS